jgi:hypothetical protein
LRIFAAIPSVPNVVHAANQVSGKAFAQILEAIMEPVLRAIRFVAEGKNMTTDKAGWHG